MLRLILMSLTVSVLEFRRINCKFEGTFVKLFAVLILIYQQEVFLEMFRICVEIASVILMIKT